MLDRVSSLQMLLCYIRKPCSVANIAVNPSKTPKRKNTFTVSSPGNKVQVKLVGLFKTNRAAVKSKVFFKYCNFQYVRCHYGRFCVMTFNLAKDRVCCFYHGIFYSLALFLHSTYESPFTHAAGSHLNTRYCLQL